MIPSAFLLPPVLGCLVAARWAAFYWEVSAELWSVVRDVTVSADIVPFPDLARRPQAAPDTQRSAEIVRFAPADR
jgi:hypothetical protein